MAFWKPGTEAASVPDRTATWESGPSTAGSFVFNPNISREIRQQKLLLPITVHRDSILYCVSKYRTLVVVGETGSGKSTQIPQYLFEASWAEAPKVIACTQPRRIAAMMLAARVSEEMGTTVGNGGLVASHVPFERHEDQRTCRLKFLTDQVLVEEAVYDPLLSRYSVIMVDEVHERGLYTDLLLGILRHIQTVRTELRIIVASATMNAEFFKDFFEQNTQGVGAKDDTARIISLSPGSATGGQVHAVSTLYLKTPCSDFVREAAWTVQKIIDQEKSSVGLENKGILVFMPGREEVDLVIKLLREVFSRGSSTVLLPLHGSLSNREQLRAFMKPPKGKQKVIVATSVAEASVTVPGIVYIVDSMFVRLPSYNANIGMELNLTEPISKASAMQRKGRAGRMAPGKCFRLCTSESFAGLSAQAVPLMLRSDLTWTVLQMTALGIGRMQNFKFPSPPSATALARAFGLLYALGALGLDAELTTTGRQMLYFQCDPRASKVLLSSVRMKCAEEALTIMAMMSVKQVFLTPRNKVQAEKAEVCASEFAQPEGDHLTALCVYNQFKGPMGRSSFEWAKKNFCDFAALERASEIRRQFARQLAKCVPPGMSLASCGEDARSTILTCICSGYFGNVARMQSDGLFRTVKDSREVKLHALSVLERFPRNREIHWVLYHDIWLDDHAERIRDVSAINPKWLLDTAPHFYKQGDEGSSARKVPADRAPPTFSAVLERATPFMGGMQKKRVVPGGSGESSALASILAIGGGVKRRVEDAELYPLVFSDDDGSVSSGDDAFGEAGSHKKLKKSHHSAVKKKKKKRKKESKKNNRKHH